jgi:hypothetical protein
MDPDAAVQLANKYAQRGRQRLVTLGGAVELGS